MALEDFVFGTSNGRRLPGLNGQMVIPVVAEIVEVVEMSRVVRQNRIESRLGLILWKFAVQIEPFVIGQVVWTDLKTCGGVGLGVAFLENVEMIVEPAERLLQGLVQVLERGRSVDADAAPDGRILDVGELRARRAAEARRKLRRRAKPPPIS